MKEKCESKIAGWVLSVLISLFLIGASAMGNLIPRTAFIAAILLTAYLGGATATHVRVGEPFFFPIIIGIVVWIALGLRKPAVFRLAFKSDKPDSLESQK